MRCPCHNAFSDNRETHFIIAADQEQRKQLFEQTLVTFLKHKFFKNQVSKILLRKY
jgi:hypothetical protein